MTQAANLAGLGSNVTTEGNLSSASTLTLQTNSTTALTINSSQNVGIGTSSPAARLDIGSGNLNFSSTAQRITGDFSNATVASRVAFQTSTTNGATRLMVIPNGTSDVAAINCINNSDPTNASWASFQVQQSSDVRIQSAIAGTGTYLPMTFYTGGSERMRISTAGGLSVGTTSDPGAGAIYATGNITAFFSDIRLKNNEGRIDNALDKVSKLSGIYYTTNETAKEYGYTDEARQVGVIAQEVKEVLPEIVKAAPFDLDENGKSKSGQDYMTVQYDKLVPLLIEAIKELSEKVAKLEGK